MPASTSSTPPRSWEDPALAALFPKGLSDIPEPFRIDPSKHPARYLLADRVVQVAGDECLPVYSQIALREERLSPVLLGHSPKVGPEGARLAADRAWASWDDPSSAATWRNASWEVRMNAVEAFARELEALTDPIATLLMYEIGKPLPDARKEVVRSVEYIRETLRELALLLSEKARVYDGRVGKEEHYGRDVLRPSGVALCVGPYNYPINEFLTTLIPALLMGNPVIGKTPRFGVLANQVLVDAFARCFPPGAVSILPGDGKEVIPAVMKASSTDVFGRPLPRVRTLAFIGSEGAAKAIVAHHPDPNFLTRILGLGAKNPALILPGTQLSDEVVGRLVKGSLGNNGQRCTAEKMLFLPEGPEGDALAQRLAERVSALPAGMPWMDGVAVTPLPEEGKAGAMQAMLIDALERGARIVNAGGGQSFASLVRPAVVDQVTDGMRLDQEEQFGPILVIRRYRDPLEMLAWARRSPYGQQAAIWGPASPARTALIEGMLDEVSRLNIDDVCQRAPDAFGFSATEKSGFGTLSLREALLAFSRTAMLQSPSKGQVTPV